MKFGKQIAQERLKSPRNYYIDYKQFKKIIQLINLQAQNGHTLEAISLDKLFYQILFEELKKIERNFICELCEIQILQEKVLKLFPAVINQENAIALKYTNFDQLLEYLRIHYITENIYQVCMNLAQLSSQCQSLRKFVIWNSIAVVKILKKKKKHLNLPFIDNIKVSDILSNQSWYYSTHLHEMISSVDTMMEEVFVRLTGIPPSEEQFMCPICLDIVVDPVTLKACFHRFCWNCLAKASVFVCSNEELERCPYCKTRCSLTPDDFVTDGILSRFLRRHFPEQINKREVYEEQREKFTINQKITHTPQSIYPEKLKFNSKTKILGITDTFNDADEELLQEAAMCHLYKPNSQQEKADVCENLSNCVNQIYNEDLSYSDKSERCFDVKQSNWDECVDQSFSSNQSTTDNDVCVYNNDNETLKSHSTDTHTHIEDHTHIYNDQNLLPQRKLKGILPTPTAPPKTFTLYYTMTMNSRNYRKYNKQKIIENSI